MFKKGDETYRHVIAALSLVALKFSLGEIRFSE